MRIRDPYAVPGTYQKAQLHCHTNRSDGRFEPKDLARRYRDAGYTFICFTDHDIVTRCDAVNDGSFLAFPGVEETIVKGVAPLGRHLGRLLVDNVLGAGSAEERMRRTLDAGGVPCLHHPSWTGNLWTGAWPAATMATLPGPFLVEVWNPHSDSEEDVRRWSHAARAHGPEVVISGVASDDCHTTLQFDHAWVMVKVPAITRAALREALLYGASYASTGIVAEFGVTGQVITAQSDADEMAVIDAAGTRRAVIVGGSGRYEPAGDEGFVRLECRTGPQRAWSQIFWITREH